MSEEAGHEVEGEGDLAPPDGRAKTGFLEQTDAEREGRARSATLVRSETGAHTV